MTRLPEVRNGFLLNDEIKVGLEPSGPAPITGDGFPVLTALAGANKIVSAWILPHDDPSRDLILNGANVEGWVAAFGTFPVTVTQNTTDLYPQWNATLYGDKGGVVFDGIDDYLESTTGIDSWPGTDTNVSLLSACRNDLPTASSGFVLSYGNGSSTTREIGKQNTGMNPSRAVARFARPAIPFNTTISGTTVLFDGSHTVGLRLIINGTSTLYVNGVSDGTASTTTSAASLTRIRIGAASAPIPGTTIWNGVVSAAAILNSTATLQDFLDLEVEFRSRVT